MHLRKWRIATGTFIATIGLVAAGAAGGTSDKAAAGSMVFGAEQEPPCLNGFTEGCNNTWTSWTVGIALASPLIENPNFSFVPYMGNARVVRRAPFTVLVTLNKKAKWSDGKPVTADDLIFTWQTIVNPKWDIASRSGWDSIARATKVGPRTVKFVYKRPYAPYKVQFTTSVLPKHALSGEDFNVVWNSNYNNKQGQSMASGPYKLASYTKGQSLVMVRNPDFFGPRPKLDKITFVFRTDTDTEIQAIRGGEVDAIYPQPQLQLADLRSQAGLRVQSNAGASLEHIDINQGPKVSNPLLRQRWFRQAIAYSIDRKAMVNRLFRTIHAGLPVLNNLTYTSQQKGKYVPHFAKYTYKPAKVTQLFRSHGCRKGGDGIWSCGGQRASVRFGTTTGNQLRELALEILQAQAKANGIELRPDSQPSRLLFPRLADGNYDLALFAWVGTGDPAGQVDIYGIGGGSNWKSYNSAAVTRLFKASDADLNPKTRVKLINRADAILANDVTTIPLYQKPTYFVFKSKLHGLLDNPTTQGPTWNTQVWRAG